MPEDSQLRTAAGAARQRAVLYLEGSFLGRCVYRFIELEGVDRALALSSRAFVAVIPLAMVASALSPAGESLGDRIVDRFELDGAAARAVQQLFATPSEVRGAVSVVGLAALVVTSVSLARTMQRTFERIWRLPTEGPRGILRALTWIGAFALWVAIVVPIRKLMQNSGLPGLGAAAAVGTSTVLWVWTPYLLLGGRVAWRRLLPSAIATGFGLSALTAASVLYLPETIERSAELYGLIGVTFTFVSWLFVTALVIIAAAVVGAEAGHAGLPGGRSSPAIIRRG
jgi:membrane protein